MEKNPQNVRSMRYQGLIPGHWALHFGHTLKASRINILENCLCQPYFWKLFDFSGVGLIGYFLVLLMGHREEDLLSPH